MHRDDRAFAEQIELAFLSKGLRPEQGTYISLDGQSACAMGALGAHNIYDASRMLNIQKSMCEALEMGFDCYDSYAGSAECSFADVMDDWDGKDADRASRLFRIGYSVAKRMFSKAPAEVVPEAELVLS